MRFSGGLVSRCQREGIGLEFRFWFHFPAEVHTCGLTKNLPTSSPPSTLATIPKHLSSPGTWAEEKGGEKGANVPKIKVQIEIETRKIAVSWLPALCCQNQTPHTTFAEFLQKWKIPDELIVDVIGIRKKTCVCHGSTRAVPSPIKSDANTLREMQNSLLGTSVFPCVAGL